MATQEARNPFEKTGPNDYELWLDGVTKAHAMFLVDLAEKVNNLERAYKEHINQHTMANAAALSLPTVVPTEGKEN